MLTVFTANPNDPRATPQSQASEYLPPVVFTQLAVSMLVFWVMSVWWERKAGPSRAIRSPGLTSRVTRVRPGSPAHQPPEGPGAARAARVARSRWAAACNLFDIPDAVGDPSKERPRDPAYNTRLIGLAMLVGRRRGGGRHAGEGARLRQAVLRGAGYGFTHIISLIVIANCFGKAIESAGAGGGIGAFDSRNAAITPTARGVRAVGVRRRLRLRHGQYAEPLRILPGPALALGIDPVSVGSLVSLGAAAGRTMSPVAAVTLMCATLTGTNPSLWRSGSPCRSCSARRSSSC